VFMGLFGPVKEKLSGRCVLFMNRDFVGDAVVGIVNCCSETMDWTFCKDRWHHG
jgi:hypothetical protein